MLLEADKTAHGATGHNAGHLVSYFERHFSNLVKEFGLNLTAKAQISVDSSWKKLEKIYKINHLKTHVDTFTGYAGCQDIQEVLLYLEDNYYRKKAHLHILPFMIAKESPILKDIPKKYNGLYSLLPHTKILSLLQSNNKDFLAVTSDKKGCLNSAMFCEEIICQLLKKYEKRFSLFEESAIQKIILKKQQVRLMHNSSSLTAQKVILCTNGYKNFSIVTPYGQDINTKFHHLVQGLVGFMGAYIDDVHIKKPTAINYLPFHNAASSLINTNPYFYLTRRIIQQKKKKVNLIAIGGPEKQLSERSYYHKDKPYPASSNKMIETFLHTTYAPAPKKKIHYAYLWHGLMGYTANGIRLVGPEPLNTRLLYNLGCNGIGILSAIFAGEKISSIIAGKPQKPSLFDVPN